MSNLRVFYGLDDQEKLDSDPTQTLERCLGDAFETVGEDFEVLASRIEWPVRVLVYRHIQLKDKDRDRIAESALEDALVNLDEWLGDPDGDATEPTAAMKEAAKALADVIVRDYPGWACEPTGEVIEYTKQQAKDFLGL